MDRCWILAALCRDAATGRMSASAEPRLGIETPPQEMAADAAAIASKTPMNWQESSLIKVNKGGKIITTKDTKSAEKGAYQRRSCGVASRRSNRTESELRSWPGGCPGSAEFPVCGFGRLSSRPFREHGTRSRSSACRSREPAGWKVCATLFCCGPSIALNPTGSNHAELHA